VNLDKYQELTGITVPASQQAKVTATIRRTKAALETLLGFSLKPKNLYTEKGKVQFEGYLPIDDLTDLLPADEEQAIYKLFPYKETDKFLHIDPFNNVYHVKLVMPTNDGEFITVLELDNVVAHYDRDGIGKFIERHYEWFTWAWYRTWRLRYATDTTAGLQLAVEADWIDCYPDDLMYLWADMVTYLTDINYNLSSESVDGHSWAKTKDAQVAPELKTENIQLLKRYAGPYGLVNRNPVK
jgi:hypothetical protein